MACLLCARTMLELVPHLRVPEYGNSLRTTFSVGTASSRSAPARSVTHITALSADTSPARGRFNGLPLARMTGVGARHQTADGPLPPGREN